MGIMHKRVAPVLAVVAALGVVGGVAYAQAFGGGSEPDAKPQVQLVQPAGESVTSSPTATPTVTVTVAPKPAPVESSEAPAPAPKVVQKKVTVSEQPADPTPEPETSPEPSAPVSTSTPGIGWPGAKPPPKP